MICKYFLPVCSLSFIFTFLMVSLILMKLNLSICSFMTCAFGIMSKKSLLNSRSQRYDPVFSSGIVIVLGLTVRSVIHFELICMCEIKVKVHIFVIGYLIVPTLFILKTVISPSNCLGNFVEKSIDHKSNDLFLDTHFSYIDLYAYLYVLNLFIVSFEIG